MPKLPAFHNPFPGWRDQVRHLRTFRSWRWSGYVLWSAAFLWLLIWFLFARGLPSADALLAYQPPLPTNVRGYDGEPIADFARERRVQLSYAEYPPVLIDAFISAEDKTFFSHPGIDVGGLAGAVWDYTTKLGSGRRAKGGSTITQQVAKNLIVGDDYSISRKIREAILAFRIEGALTKQQILEIYLNQIFLGRNAYGVQSASRAYFRKDVGELTLPEAAYLAILPKAPSNYTVERHADRALERRNYVLQQMQENGFITAEQRQAAAAAPLGIVPRYAPRASVGGYFMEEVRRQLIERYGETAEDGPNSVYSGGLWVRTSYDGKVQEAAEDALRDGLVRFEAAAGWRGRIARIDIDDDWARSLANLNVGAGYSNWSPAVVLSKQGSEAEIGFENGSRGTLPSSGATMPKAGVGGRAFDFLKAGDVIVVRREGNGGWTLRSIPSISGGMVVQNPHTGQILAMQGGFDSRGSSFNRATQAKRQPGSTFKPFVYAAALDNGMTPASIIIDGPFCVYQSARLGQKCFKNFSGSNAGQQTMRWGVEQSRNLMTVRTASQIGMDKVVRTAKVMGIGDYPPYLAYALGAGETTVQQIVNAYSIFANQGRAVTPTVIDYVQDRNGKLIWRADKRACEGCNMAQYDGRPMPRPRLRSKQVIDAMTAYQMLHIMEGVVERGTATVLRDLGRPMFGKTGTSSGPTNVWFVGGSADMVGGLYLGYDNPRSMGGYAQGGTIAAPIFRAFAAKAMKDMPVVPFRAPPGIRMIRIDRKTGRRVFGAWPDGSYYSPVIWEAFKPESEPRRTIRRDEIAKRAAPAARATTDSEFLQSQDGIY
ncbi:PBP1A family penicillin-binding protein [Sphingomonas histidinilytica]|uniref:Penicillin-binding protein 1A n=1 Tax=Rhizorhabdus histidinilytica TaxID=439228 RepID=A0A1T5AY07_9SPHN|nr:PBP1A family penicillin-binding protein [Rhizorhabdus histidinilytica]MBO9377741.1 PBP1A family penicillin-binding protein [Rhizorhabdus histidinilytica]QEH79543.1 PBP1A family penicillin-binding protein [Sphingomonas sp. C8-2]SKB39856.1 penicillin-binding protein 1A [Rhizorhabdus histidinilytica]